MKWWGWGESGRRHELPPAALDMLREEVGPAEPSERVPTEAVRLPEPAGLPSALAGAVGTENVLEGAEERLMHSAGKSYPDLVRARAGAPASAPDAVIRPPDAGAVHRVLEICSREGVAVVPFGGGTSVVGGVDALRGEHSAVVSLDLGLLRAVDVDRTSLTARLGPGLTGPQAEAALGSRGLTLGHFPQSFEYATIGGFAATRSAGQASAGYGRFDELVSALELTAPAGALRTLATPHTAAGPSLREVVLGSEGVLGVITDVAVRVRPRPESRRYEGWIAQDFRAGHAVVRSLAQAGALPDVMRLSDREETRVSLGLSGTEGFKRSLLDTYLRLRGRSDGCIMICGWEGERENVERRRALSARFLRKGGAVPLGPQAGRSWRRGRFDGPYLRDELLDLGYLVETLETSHTWARYEEHYQAVGAALRGAMEAAGTPGIVMCHLSHAYADGASLYFTFIAPRKPGGEIDQWRALKGAASAAITATGGTITHHHAVGRDHAPYMRSEVGELGLDAIRAVKEVFDPAGVMNPGKLLPPPMAGRDR